MRPLALVLVLLPLTAVAQDTPTSQPAAKPDVTKPAAKSTLRVSLAADVSLDGTAVDANTAQAYIFGELHKFGLRVDSLRATNTPGFDEWITSQLKRWDKREPDAPGPTLAIVVSQTADYNTAEFMGQPQCHIFKGGLTVEILGADGKPIAEFGYKFQWGKTLRRKNSDGSITHFRKEQIQTEFDELLQKAAVVGLLCNEEIRSGVPERKRDSLEKYLKKNRDYLLKILGKKTEAVKKGELATFLRSLKIETK